MPSVEQLQKLKREVEELKTRQAQAEGALQRFKDDNRDLGNPKDLRKKLERLEKQRVEKEQRYNLLLANYTSMLNGKRIDHASER
jgi:septal ring factor EnvC (AmiA/AmiB activator)